jgi:hypothetical protein
MAFPVYARLPSGDIVGRILGQALGGVIDRGLVSPRGRRYRGEILAAC